jgi:hypothetical protein
MPYLYSMLIAKAIGILMYCCSSNTELPRFDSVLVFMAFVSTVAWLDLLGNECVAVLESIGKCMMFIHFLLWQHMLLLN